MNIIRTKSQLESEVLARGLSLPEEKYSRENLVDILAAQSLESITPGFGLTARLRLKTPMLCFAYKHMKPQEQVTAMTSNQWIAQEKIDGCRCIITYHPSEGFRFFSRNISVTDYLPVEYTDKILIIKNGKVSTGPDWIGRFDKSFVVDAEVVATGNIDTTQFTVGGVRTTTELNAVSALLAIEAEASKQIQISQASVAFKVFDLIEDGEDIRSKSYRVRLERLHALVDLLKELPISIAEYTIENKEEFYLSKIKEGGEGIVLKNINSAYISTTSRRRDVQVKRKRSLEEALGADIDAYVGGFVPAKEDKQWKDLIGAFKMFVTLKNPDGTETEHWVGSVSAMPLEVRSQVSELDEQGKPRLKKEFYGKVLTINGQDISGRSHRFTHCVADWNRGFRTDKSYLECSMERDFLETQIL